VTSNGARGLEDFWGREFLKSSMDYKRGNEGPSLKTVRWGENNVLSQKAVWKKWSTGLEGEKAPVKKGHYFELTGSESWPRWACHKNDIEG